MSAEGVPVAEREAFAAYITSQENIGFDAVVWRGVGGDPLGIVHEPQYSENSLRSEWAAWLARSTHPAAASAEREALAKCVEALEAIAKDAPTEDPDPPREGWDALDRYSDDPQDDMDLASRSEHWRLAEIARAALSTARATKEVDRADPR